jgi:hypothetical protein
VNEVIPEVEWEVAVCAAQSCDEVVLEGSDRAFGGVGPMDAGGGLVENRPPGRPFGALVIKKL